MIPGQLGKQIECTFSRNRNSLHDSANESETLQMDVQIEVEIVHCLLSIVLPAFSESCYTV